MTPCTSIRVCATLATLALLGCASAKERAQESLLAGNYDDAIQRYERIVSRDAGDPEAVSGLRDARSGWLGQKLIQARMSRMAGNTNEALDFLMETVNRENSWKMAPGGKVAFTQEEESGFAWPTFVARVQSLLKEKHPLRAEILLRKYEPAFQGRPKTELASVHTAVRRGGKNSCLSLKNERMRDKPYFARFVSTYCQFWSEGGAKADSISDTLYGDTQIAVAGDGIGAETQGMVRTAVQKSFAQTAWYDARGKLKLEGKVDGQFSQSKNKTGLVLIQTYKENENYVETVPVEKHRQVAQQVLHQVVDPNTHLLQNIETTELKSESYWEQEPQTRTRQVEKNYRYPAWKHEQSLALALNGQSGSPVGIWISRTPKNPIPTESSTTRTSLSWA